MQYRQLGQTDIDVSVIAMGCWSIVGDANWGRQDEEDSLATIHATLDAGINFFDTAQAYGDGYSETLLGETLAGMRHQVVIATKVVPVFHSAAEIQESCEGSLRRLKTDYIDLYQLHWPSREVPLAESLDTLQKLQQQGKVRAIGVCNFGPEDLTELLELGRSETNQLPYSLLWRAIEYEIQPLCVEHSLGILTYSTLLQGLLTGKFASADEVPEGRARTRHFSKDRPLTRHGEPGCEAETFATIDRIGRICREIDQPMAEVAIAWTLRQPGVASVLAGVRTPDQVLENAQAADLALPGDVVEALTAETEELKVKLGSNPDLWQSESRFR